jgi:hypothetical protein
MINRLLVFLLTIFAIANGLNGMLIQSAADVSAAFAFQCEQFETARPFFVIAALGSLYKMRIVGVVGFLLAAAGRMDIAQSVLALHYGVIAIDDNNVAPIGRLASGMAGVALAL